MEFIERPYEQPKIGDADHSDPNFKPRPKNGAAGSVEAFSRQLRSGAISVGDAG